MGEIYWPSVFFLLLAILACGFAVAVLLSPNIVRMAFYLVLSLAATAGLFFLAGQDFVGAMQLLIYVGGTLVLLVFGVMLTSQERFVSMKTMAGDWVIGLFAGGALLFFMVLAAVSIPKWQSPKREVVEQVVVERTATPIGLDLLGISDRPAYLLPFEIVSVHLLVVLVGAAYLARAQAKGERTVVRGEQSVIDVHRTMINLPLANLLTEPPGVAHFMVVGAVMFVCGAMCMATKRNGLGVLMGIELVLNGANLNFVAFSSRYLGDGALGIDGPLIALFVIVLAAAEAAVALAIALNFYNNHDSIDIDRGDQLQG